MRSEKRTLAEYLINNDEDMLQYAAKVVHKRVDKEEFKQRFEENRKEYFLEMRTYGQFKTSKPDVKDNSASWACLGWGDLKRATESKIIAAQGQAFVTDRWNITSIKNSDTQKFTF